MTFDILRSVVSGKRVFILSGAILPIHVPVLLPWETGVLVNNSHTVHTRVTDPRGGCGDAPHLLESILCMFFLFIFYYIYIYFLRMYLSKCSSITQYLTIDHRIDRPQFSDCSWNRFWRVFNNWCIFQVLNIIVGFLLCWILFSREFLLILYYIHKKWLYVVFIYSFIAINAESDTIITYACDLTVHIKYKTN